MFNNIQNLKKEFDETRYIMEAVFSEDKQALEQLREYQRQMEYQKKLEVLKQKQRKAKEEEDSLHDPSIRLFEENTMIEMDSEERVYEAVVGSEEKEEKRKHSVN